MPIERTRLTGTVQEMLDVPVPLHRLAAGAVIQPGDLTMAHLRATSTHGEIARTPAQAVGLFVRHMVQQGQPLALAELAPVPDINRGARVTMQLQSPGLALLAQGQAMESGAIGDRIQVMNPVSRAIVEAEVIGRDRVRVLPGSVPVQSPNGRPVQYSNIAPLVATP
jgi:flagella basal body P-ring formation protein FlgA